MLQQEVEKITTNTELEDREITETLLNSTSEFQIPVLLHYYVFVRKLMIRRITKVTKKTGYPKAFIARGPPRTDLQKLTTHINFEDRMEV